MNSTNQKEAVKPERYEMLDNVMVEIPSEVKKQGKEGVKYTRDIRNDKALMANIDANKKAAIKYVPDIHRKMSQIFIKCAINGEFIKALVDTGATANYMTVGCAKRCNVTDLINTEFCHDVQGVTGTIKSLGDIHHILLTIERKRIRTSFMILKSNISDMVLGIRTLIQYQCAIDIKTRTLSFGKINVKTPLLEDDDNPPPQEEEFHVKRYEQLNELEQYELDTYFDSAYRAGHFAEISRSHVICLVNGHPVKALLDSGAERSFMSRSCAERCGILKLTDTKCSANSVDVVATTKTFGRVHFCPVQIEDNILCTPLDILDMERDMLLGIDILERYHCTINLKNNTLLIGRTTTAVNSPDVIALTKLKDLTL